MGFFGRTPEDEMEELRRKHASGRISDSEFDQGMQRIHEDHGIDEGFSFTDRQGHSQTRRRIGGSLFDGKSWSK
jgi:hypothetical protein